MTCLLKIVRHQTVGNYSPDNSVVRVVLCFSFLPLQMELAFSRFIPLAFPRVKPFRFFSAKVASVRMETSFSSLSANAKNNVKVNLSGYRVNHKSKYCLRPFHQIFGKPRGGYEILVIHLP